MPCCQYWAECFISASFIYIESRHENFVGSILLSLVNSCWNGQSMLASTWCMICIYLQNKWHIGLLKWGNFACSFNDHVVTGGAGSGGTSAEACWAAKHAMDNEAMFSEHREYLVYIWILSCSIVLALSWRLGYHLLPVPAEQQILNLNLCNWTRGSFEIINDILVKNMGVEITIYHSPAGEAWQRKTKLQSHSSVMWIFPPKM